MSQQLAELLGPRAKAAGLIAAMDDFNLGTEDDYRIPDGGIHRPGPDEMYYDTVVLVIEVVSPGDESWEKLPFYAAHNVDELLFVDPEKRTVDWLGLADGEYKAIERSSLIDLGPTGLARQVDWPLADG
jgi:Uma2 family endonuclease